MPAKITVKDKHVQQALSKLVDLKQFKQTMADAQALVYKDVTKQPKKKRGAFSALATPGQRRAYWAKVSSGEAQHGPNGYVRSGKLKRGWEAEPIRQTANRMTGVVRNTADSVKWVQGNRQQPFHKASKWPTDRSTADRRRKRIVKMFRDRARELTKEL